MEDLKMRGCLTVSRIALILAGLCLALSFQTSALAVQPTSDSSQQAVASGPATAGSLVSFNEYYETADAKPPAVPENEPAPSVQVNCGPGCGCCCEPVCGHWILGIETVWLSPQPQGNVSAYYHIVDDAHTVARLSGGYVPGLFITPRITAGYQGEEWGIQTRYWRMNETTTDYTPNPVLGSVDETSGYSYFNAQTVDLEATRLFCWGDTLNQLSFGVRYGELNQKTNVRLSRLLLNEGALFSGSAAAEQNFSGTGVTMGLNGLKPLPCRNFSLFYSLRGSVLWDNKASTIAENQSDVTTGAGLVAEHDIGYAISDGQLFIGEVQLGAQWNFELVRNRADAFFRLALEYQYWDTSNTAAETARSIEGTGNGIGAAGSRSGDTAVSLIGFTIATGFTW